METVQVVACLILERIHPSYNQRLARLEARKVAKAYVAERGLPEDMDLQDIDEKDLVSWLRARRYEILDHPVPDYGVGGDPREDRGEWRPRQ